MKWKWFNDFFLFDSFITKDVMALVYAIGALLITIVAIEIAVMGQLPPFSYKNPGEAYVAAVLVFLIGNLFWRIICEYIVILFKINESLISIDKSLRIEDDHENVGYE
jgi:hypothetical protein